ncbi:acetate--CoA ligase family protein [Streptomyces sp. NPDC001978]|uniref:acetate--CoA ligase family protein n=1 Tax=Streptomyces sp. NPDC001978 TaxID=3364627 RepID=UPI00368DD36D
MTPQSDVSDLSKLFSPQHIAFIGVSRRERTLGALALGFAKARPGLARLSVIHPELAEIQGVQCARSIADLDSAVDVAFISVPGAAVGSVIEDCAAHGVPYAVIGSSGYAETGSEGADRQAELVETARSHGLRLLGPNCNGLWNAIDGLSLGFNTSHEHALRPGGVGVVAQTGAVLGSFIAGVQRAGGGISYAVSTGNEADIDAAELFEFMVHDDRCRVIALLLDTITRPDVFERAARRAAEVGKPVLAVTFGKSPKGRHAAELHSARVAGGGRAFSAWLRSLGIVETSDLESAMFALALLDNGEPFDADLAVISTSGAGAALIADLAADAGITLPDFSPDTLAELDKLLTFTKPYNPLDLAGHGNDPQWLDQAFDAIFSDPAMHAVALMSTLLPPKARGIAPVVSAFAAAKVKHAAKSACAYAVGPLAEEHRADLIEAGVAIADSGHSLVGGLHTAGLVRTYAAARAGKNRTRPAEAAGERWLGETPAPGASKLVLHDAARSELTRLGIPFLEERSVTSGAEARKAWLTLGGSPVAMKIMDSNMPHKASSDGLVLGVAGEDEAAQVAEQLMSRAVAGDARVLMQTMAPIAVELFLGTVDDPQAGPVIAFGRGGSAVEESPDVAVEVAPVSPEEAADMISSVPVVVAALTGLARRSGRAYDALVDELSAVISTLSEVAANSRATVHSIDVNPLAYTESGQMAAIDVRVQLRPVIAE